MLKKIFSFLLCLILVASLFACGGNAAQPTEPTVPADPYAALEADVAALDSAYKDRIAYHGELHDHADTGGTSDGHRTLAQWKTGMAEVGIDFATIVDHRQILHMELEDWDSSLFIGGSEAGAVVPNLQAATSSKAHINLLFANSQDFVDAVTAYDAQVDNLGFMAQEYAADYDGPEADKLAGGWHYTPLYYDYNRPSKENLATLIQIVRDHGGMFVLVHPKSPNYIVSDNPLDYWFADYTGLEVFYGFGGYAPSRSVTMQNYQLWKDLLSMGKKVWCTAGSDKHKAPNTDALTTVYSEAKDAAVYMGHIASGDMVCGPVGIRMTIGDATMGGETAFAGQRVIFSVGDFHESAYSEKHTYQVEVYTDKGLVFKQKLSDPTQLTYFALDADPEASFYRVEVWNTTTNMLHALGNPIWNVK